MATRSKGQEIVEQGMFAGASSRANPLGDLIFVDSANGSDGNNGLEEAQAVASLTRAVALAEAGDTIILAAGGSETVTSSIAVTQAGLKIICLHDNFASAFEINGAASLDLMTVSGANVHLEGLRFDRAATAGSTTAAVLTTATADRLTVKNCLFDCSDTTSSWTNYGIELTEACNDVLIEGCKFVDCHRGVLIATSGSNSCLRPTIKDCEFHVGQATAFGIFATPAGSSNVYGMVIRDNVFRELKGAGTAGETWDGTDDTDATVGPYRLNARVDQCLSYRNVADTVAGTAFDTLNNITAGATVQKVSNRTSTLTDESAAIASVGLVLSAQVVDTSTDILSVGTLTSTDVLSAGVAASTDTLSVGTQVGSVGTLVSTVTVNTSTDTLSVGTLVSALGTASLATSAALSSQVVATSTDILSAQVALSTDNVSVGVLASTDVLSVGTQVSTALINTSTDTLSVGTAASTDTLSVGTQVSTTLINTSTDTLSVGTLVSALGTASLATSAALSSQVVATSTDILSAQVALSTDAVSLGVLTSTDVLSAQVALSTDNVSVGTLATAGATGVGTPITATKVVAMASWPNNAQSYALWTATGDIIIEEIIFEKDATPAAGATNFELTTNNTYGPTGLASDIFKNVAAGFGANLKLLATAGGTTAMTEFMLENGAIVYAHGDDGVGSGGNIQVTVRGRRVTAGASIA